MRRFLIVFVTLFIFLNGFSAAGFNIGTPVIKNFNKREYNAGSQNWEIIQGLNGKMYFANNSGLLEFDGVHWNLYPIANSSILRSIFQTEDGKIYAGGFGEFGYYALDNNGVMQYHSLVGLLKESDKEFGEIWNISQQADGLIFQAFEQIVVLNENKVSVIKAPTQFHFSFLVNNEFYVNDREKGLMRYAMGQIFPVRGMENLRGIEIWGIVHYNDQLLIATVSDGLYLFNGNDLRLWQNPVQDYLKKNQLYSLYKMSSGDLIFGTIQDGLLILKSNGRYLNVNLADGLQNNTVLALGEDYLGNIWVATDYGIDYVDISSPILKISQKYGLSAGYAAYIKSEIVYFGTNQGVFYKEKAGGKSLLESAKLDMLPKTKGQVWFLDEIGDELICGHTNGTFSIEKTKVTQISDEPGGWFYLNLPGNKNKMIGGCYSGLMLFEKKGASWKFIKKYDNFEHSSRSLAFDEDGSLWMAHGYEGVYHIFFSPDYDSIVNYDFYPLLSHNLIHGLYNVVNYNQKVLFQTNDGLYVYKPSTNKFEKENNLNQWLEGDGVKYMREDEKGDIWYFNKNDLCVLRLQEDRTFNKVGMPFKSLSNQFIGSFEFVYPHDKNNIFVAIEDGFALYNPTKTANFNYEYKSFISKITSHPNDSAYFDSNHTGLKDISYANNNLAIEFSANDFKNVQSIQFSSYLEGYDKNWTQWNRNYRREFTNLEEGNYSFKLKAKNIFNRESPIINFQFTINPPYYRTIWAYIIYGILIILLMLFIIFLLRRRMELAREKSIKEEKERSRQREELLRRESLEAEKEVIRLRNEQLQKSMNQKNKELANATYQMIHKNETLINLKEMLRSMLKTMTNEENIHLAKRLVKIINKDIDSEKQWEIFETHFENVHEEFLKRLKKEYPNLSPRELKLCAYLRMNSSSKEISVLMNISTRGVEIARYRLRKKLDLPRETNLANFIISF
jgi:ligand-binding sensor domain-containing protein/DNA-binding CsgD family transcriptional regulator